MDSFHHKSIKKFSLGGIINDDSSLVRMREEYRRLLLREMEIAGYVPRIDINQDFTIKFNEKSNFYEFELSIYAVYVGKRKAEWIIGIDETTVIYTQKHKSNEYSSEVV